MEGDVNSNSGEMETTSLIEHITATAEEAQILVRTETPLGNECVFYVWIIYMSVPCDSDRKLICVWLREIVQAKIWE